MHFDQNLIFIIVAAVIGISRLVARIAENSREQSQRRNQQAQHRGQSRRQLPPSLPTRPKTDEERVREFLEALGQPVGTTPPAKVQPRTNVPLRPMAPIPPPPLSRPFSPVLLKPMAEKVRRMVTPSSLPAAVPIPSVSVEADEPGAWLREEEKIETAAAKFREAARATADYGAVPREAAAVNWKTALRSRDSVRAALVLREILGPPRALRELEFV
jgi:hypothetical protein